MKTKQQKQQELEKGRKLLGGSSMLLFADIAKVSAEDIRKLRSELRKNDSELLVMKKRLVGVFLKEKNIEFNPRETKTSLGTVFSSADPEKVSSVLFKFFKGLSVDPTGGEKLLGGYDIKKKELLSAEQVRFIGQLPPREILLAKLLYMLASPIRSFLYVLQEQSKKTSSS